MSIFSYAYSTAALSRPLCKLPPLQLNLPSNGDTVTVPNILCVATIRNMDMMIMLSIDSRASC